MTHRPKRWRRLVFNSIKSCASWIDCFRPSIGFFSYLTRVRLVQIVRLWFTGSAWIRLCPDWWTDYRLRFPRQPWQWSCYLHSSSRCSIRLDESMSDYNFDGPCFNLIDMHVVKAFPACVFMKKHFFEHPWIPLLHTIWKSCFVLLVLTAPDKPKICNFNFGSSILPLFVI